MESSKNKKLLLIVGISILAIIIVSLIIWGQLMVGKIPKGVKIAGVDVSLLLPEEAYSKLSLKAEEYFSKPIKLQIEDNSYQLELTDEIVSAQIDETIKNQVLITNPFQAIVSFFKPYENKELILETDNELLLQSITDLHNSDYPAPMEAEFVFDEKGNITVTEQKSGQRITEDSLAKLISEVAQMKPAPTVLKLEEYTPVVSSDDLEQQKEKLTEIVNRKITLEDPKYSDDWNIVLKNRPELVEFNIDRESGETTIGINKTALDEYIDEDISKWLDIPVDGVKISQSEEGERAMIEGKGHDGLKVEREELKQMIETAIVEGENKVTIPVSEIKATVEVDDYYKEKGITEVIGIGHSSYYGSPVNRKHNINVAANRFNGLAIAPGETFSFNENLGRVDGTTGYRKELVIKAEGTIPEYGGGVCQVSTTMYRAALFSGLKIADRREHSYAVSYYSQVLGHGLDATIYLGGQDFKFTNDTENHILIHSYVEGDNEIYFVFYGTSDGREVEMEGPFLGGYRSPGATIYQETTTLAPGQQKQVEKSHTGFSADWKRHITLPTGETITEDIKTTYRAIPARILVGAGAATE
ncbi:hypothetical protein CVV38_00950 [Candidatus Peregrinibacteria bacterium HGW-Peregrinibacteria-1]|jgi:vancomycin resistance protein YoaR|nr:MAG: hypothetical protein CVV38_00950 [Candidatus Peregrinibacteria bacterium HGW-Peregrinibacteria-1]